MNIIGIIGGNVLNTKLVGRVGALRMISGAAFVSVVAAIAVALVALTGWGGLWSIVARKTAALRLPAATASRGSLPI